MYLHLDQIKKHLYIDDYFTDDDEYLMSLALVAESVVERHIDSNLNYLADGSGELPAPLIHAMLLLIGNLYNNRESVATFKYAEQPIELPLSYSYLLDLYKNYSNSDNV